MAGGIDWFRWHHGCVTDPKFQLVAKKALARLGDVITVWAFVLEQASQEADRGSVGEIDFETLDFLLGAEDGTSVRIHDAMKARGLIVDGRIASWDKRQPKREDDTATERKRRQREREAACVTEDESRDVTPCHADVTQCHDRVEESREEKRREENSSSLRSEEIPRKRGKSASPPDVSVADLVGEGVDEQVAKDWLRVRKAKDSPLTATAWEGFKREALKAGLDSAEAVRIATEHNWAGFKAKWMEGEAANAVRQAINGNRQEALEQRNRSIAAEWAAQEGA